MCMYLWDVERSVFRQGLLSVRRRGPHGASAERHSRSVQDRVKHIIRLDYNVLSDTSHSKRGLGFPQEAI